MLKIFKNAFSISTENIILATPLLLYMLLINVYLILAQDAIKSAYSAILFLLILFLITSAFLAGWIYMIKIAVNNFLIGKSYDKDTDLFALIKEFPVGLSDYFMSFMGYILIYAILVFILIFGTYEVGMHFIGSVGVPLKEIKTAMESAAAMRSLIESMTIMQLIKLNWWYFLAVGVSFIFSFVTMFWAVEILTKIKNPLVALFTSIVKVFSNIKNILFFILVWFLNLIITFFNNIAINNPISFFLMTILYFYFIVYLFVLVFLYYEEQNKSNSDSGTDSLGQE